MYWNLCNKKLKIRLLFVFEYESLFESDVTLTRITENEEFVDKFGQT